MRRSAFVLVLGFAAASSARAAGRVLDGAEMPINTARTWCIAPTGELPNWTSPAHPECEMAWKVLAERDGRVLYSARYAWPSPSPAKAPLRVLSEVLFEGRRGTGVVRRLYAVQDDEAHVRPAPLHIFIVAGQPVIESLVCVPETGECGRELAAWAAGHMVPVRDLTVADIRAKLPPRFDLRMNPAIDLLALRGKGSAWAAGDRDCCPSASIEFTLRLVGGELRAGDLRFTRRSG
ncbi:MAG TPA: hypothetical protein VFV19_17845 [Candidatus Polarisedimenticolaceae bacterium]|nr:hypothetical protein [Candidatus Polarisedimenticolaceae bacterium]